MGRPPRRRLVCLCAPTEAAARGAGAAAGVHIILHVIPIIMHNYSVKLIISLATSASTSRVVLEIEEENIISNGSSYCSKKNFSPLSLVLVVIYFNNNVLQ